MYLNVTKSQDQNDDKGFHQNTSNQGIHSARSAALCKIGNTRKHTPKNMGTTNTKKSTTTNIQTNKYQKHSNKHKKQKTKTTTKYTNTQHIKTKNNYKKT